MKPAYQSIVRQSESYLRENGDTNWGVGWPSAHSQQKHYEVILDVVPEGSEKVTLLDFGCGAAGLYEFIRKHGRNNIEYTGLDVSDSFLGVSREKFPDLDFYQCDILVEPETVPQFDYVIANGIFTQKCELSFDEMWAYMQSLLPVLWSKCSRALAFNVMSKHVDWERDDLFHLPLDALASFLCRDLTRNFVFRNDYGYYDYTAYVYR
ncbi:MAG: class I SAM-dependent methyltransferase [Lysobacteraceae bacterium]